MDKLTLGYYLKVFGLLFLLIAILIGVLFLIKKISLKTQGAAKDSQLKIIGNLPIGPKKSLMLVQFLDSILLIGVTETNISILKEVNRDHGQEFNKIIRDKIFSNNINNS